MPQHAHISAQPLCSVDSIARARERLGFHRSDAEWRLLQWYVEEFAQKHVSASSEGELLSLQEELVALEQEVNRYWTGDPFSHTHAPIPDRDAIQALQERILDHLVQLADTGQTTIGPMMSTETVEVMPRQELTRRPLPPDRVVMRHVDLMTEPQEEFSMVKEALVLRFSDLLKSVPQGIRRCPKANCRRLFLQARRDAIYCTRICQSVEAAARSRAEEALAKAKRAKRTTAQKHAGQTRSQKGARKHGTKRR